MNKDPIFLRLKDLLSKIYLYSIYISFEKISVA